MKKGLTFPEKAAIIIGMNKIEELEIGMNVMIIKDGEYQDSGYVIDILEDEIVFKDGEEGFSYERSEIDGFFQLAPARRTA